jgi:DNA-binding NtrC family response regulator
MIVDDEQDILIITRRAVERWDYEAEAYSNPIEALQRFREAPNAFALALLDVRMPMMDGISLAKELTNVNPSVKIELMTAFDIDQELFSKLPMMKKEDILQKPFKLVQICEAIKRHMGSIS